MDNLSQVHLASGGLPRGGASPDDGDEPPGFRPEHSADDVRMSKLMRAIEHEIIPRLMLVHRTAAKPLLRPASSAHAISSDDVKQFAKLVLLHDEAAAFAAIHSLRERKVTMDRVFLELLAPTARYLGELWDDDLCDFTDVTVALGRLQRVLRELSPTLGRSVELSGQRRRVLLLPSPGEQHTFGLVMVSEFFRQAGWDVAGGGWTGNADGSIRVSAEWFDVVGFSLGAEIHLQELADSISVVRRLSCNRNLKVLVGGPLFGYQPEVLTRLGADGMTTDGREAPLLAESLIARHVCQRASFG